MKHAQFIKRMSDKAFDYIEEPALLIPITQTIDGMGHSEGDSRGTEVAIKAVIQPVTAKMIAEMDLGWATSADWVMFIRKGIYPINQRDYVQYPLSTAKTADATTEEYSILSKVQDWRVGGQNIYESYVLRRREIDRV